LVPIASLGWYDKSWEIAKSCGRRSMWMCQYWSEFEVLPSGSENLDIPRKTLALRTCATTCLLPYLSTLSQPTGVFISARGSEFWLFSWHRFHVCLSLSKWRMLMSKELALNFAPDSTKLQLKLT
jgi:hypothetical protein